MPIIQPIISGGSSAPELYIEKTKNINNALLNSANTVINLSGIEYLGNYVLAGQYANTSITSLDMRDVISGATNIGDSCCRDMCRGCSSLTSINLSSFKTVSRNSMFENAFSACTSLPNVNLRFELIIGVSACEAMFNVCNSMISADLSYLTVIDNDNSCKFMFANCTSLTNVILSSLKSIGGSNSCTNMFQNDTSLTTLYLPALKSISSSATGSMLNGVTGCTVHLPVNYTGYVNFGGTNTTVLKDLPSALLLTGANTTVYERSPKDDTATALAWRVQDIGGGIWTRFDWTPYYTSGLTDPVVNDTIYSDSACTVAVTTIDSIA